MNKSVAGMRRYVIEFSVGMTLFILTMIFHRRLVPVFPDWNTVIYLLPIVPVILVATAIWRGIAAMDEYHRRNTINAVAFGAFLVGISACISPFLKNAGLIPEPHFSMAWPVMATGWIMMAFGYMWRDTTPEERGKLGSQLGTFIGFLVGTAFLYWLLARGAGWPHGWKALLAAAGFGAIPAAIYNVFARRCGLA